VDMSCVENRELLQRRIFSLGLPAATAYELRTPFAAQFWELLRSRRVEAAFAFLDDKVGHTLASQALSLFYHELGARPWDNALHALDCFLRTYNRNDKSMRRPRLILPPELREGLFFELKQFISTHLPLVSWAAQNDAWTDDALLADLPDRPFCQLDLLYPHATRVFSSSYLPWQGHSLLDINFFAPAPDVQSQWIRAVHGSLFSSSRDRKKETVALDWRKTQSFYAWIRALRGVSDSAGYPSSHVVVPFADVLAAYDRAHTEPLTSVAHWYKTYRESARHLVLENVLNQLRLLPQLRTAFKTRFPRWERWVFAKLVVIDDARRILCSPLRHHPELETSLGVLYDGVVLLQPKRRPKAPSTATLSSRVRANTVWTEESPTTLTTPTVPKYTVLTNIYALVEEYLRVHDQNQDTTPEQTLEQIDWVMQLFSAFSDANKRPKGLKLHPDEDIRFPWDTAKKFVPVETITGLGAFVHAHPRGTPYNHFDLQRFGVPHKTCTQLFAMQEAFCRHEQTSKQTREIFTSDPLIKYTVYCWLNLIIQRESVRFIEINDGRLVAQQIQIIALATNKHPLDLSPADGQFVASTRSGKIKSGVGAVVGAKGVIYNPITRQYVDSEKDGELLIKRRQFIPTPLVSEPLIGRVVVMPLYPFKSTQKHKRGDKPRIGIAGDGAPQKLRKLPIRMEMERIYHEQQPVERSVPRPPYRGLILPPRPPGLPEKTTINSTYKRVKAEQQHRLRQEFEALKEDFHIDTEANRKRSNECIPATPSITAVPYRPFTTKHPEYKIHQCTRKKWSSLVICGCCRNVETYSMYLFGPWSGCWCGACARPDYMKRLLPLCRWCNSCIVTNGTTFAVVDTKCDVLRRIQVCSRCAKNNRAWINHSGVMTSDFLEAVESRTDSLSAFEGYIDMSLNGVRSFIVQYIDCSKFGGSRGNTSKLYL
jgi:hypothetical protein